MIGTTISRKNQDPLVYFDGEGLQEVKRIQPSDVKNQDNHSINKNQLLEAPILNREVGPQKVKKHASSASKQMMESISLPQFENHCLNISNLRFSHLLSKPVPQIMMNKQKKPSLVLGLTDNVVEKVRKEENKVSNVSSSRQFSLCEYYKEMCWKFLSNVKQREVEMLADAEIKENDPNDESSQFDFRSPEISLELAKGNINISRNMLRYMQEVSQEVLTTYEHYIVRNINELVLNNSTCCLMKHLIKVSEKVRQAATELCEFSMEDLMDVHHTSRFVYALCNCSEDFRQYLYFFYKTKLSKIISKLPGAVLLSILLHNEKEIEKYDFILDEMRANPFIAKMEYFGRGFVTFMSKCSEATLEIVVDLLSKTAVSSIFTNYGNYMLQVFYERNCLSGIKLCEMTLLKILKKAFIRKYSRFVLFKAVDYDTNGDFIRPILEGVFEDSHIILDIIKKKVSSGILLFCLAKLEGSTLLLAYIKKLKKVRSGYKKNFRRANEIMDEFFNELNKLENSIKI